MKNLVFARIFLHCVALGFIVSGLLLSGRPPVRIWSGVPKKRGKQFACRAFCCSSSLSSLAPDALMNSSSVRKFFSSGFASYQMYPIKARYQSRSTLVLAMMTLTNFEDVFLRPDVGEGVVFHALLKLMVLRTLMRYGS